MAERFHIEVDPDQFDKLSRPTQPLPAVAELIWNSLDAEADVVDVTLGLTEMEAVETVQVVDDGHGMTYDDAIHDFRKLGGSWKKGRKTSRTGKRALHGQQGEGRFRAFALGRRAEWVTVASSEAGGLEQTTINGSIDDSEFAVSDPVALGSGKPGTTVTASIPREHVNRLLGTNTLSWLTLRFAAYLAKYPHVRVVFQGRPLDPASIIEAEETVALDPALGGDLEPPLVRIVEWKPQVVGVKPALVICNQDGVALHEITDELAGSDVRFTAYLIWSGFDSLASDLLIGELGHPILEPIIAAARDAIRGYLIDRRIKQRQSLIEDWKARQVYPFTKPPEGSAEVRERRMFDLVAVTAADAVSSEPRAAKLSLRLLREALEQSPMALHRVMREVLNLTKEQVEDFDRLLGRTSLASIIRTTATITERFDFLHGLDRLLFDEDTRSVLRERDQLHQLLVAGHTWVFGEMWGLVVSDKSLTKVLKEHLHLLGDPVPVLDPVTDPSGNVHRRVDLMLSAARMGAMGRSHLIVELKRPSVRIGQAEINQIQNYAITVANDPRFKAPDVTWDFWLLGNDLDSLADALATQDQLPHGVIMQKDNYTIRVRRWSEVIEENRQRLHFFRERLDYEAPDDATLEATLAKYLPGEATPEQPPGSG